MGNLNPLGGIKEIKKSGQRYVDRPLLIPPKPLAIAIHLMLYQRPLTSIFVGYERVRLDWQ